LEQRVAGIAFFTTRSTVPSVAGKCNKARRNKFIPITLSSFPMNLPQTVASESPTMDVQYDLCPDDGFHVPICDDQCPSGKIACVLDFLDSRFLVGSGGTCGASEIVCVSY
jgi:hypothetical protein